MVVWADSCEVSEEVLPGINIAEHSGVFSLIGSDSGLPLGNMIGQVSERMDLFVSQIVLL